MVRRGCFEAEEQAFFWLYLRPGDQIIDGGAHVGLYALLALMACERDARILAIEANPATADLLRANLADHGADQVEVVQAAIWREEGSVPFAPGDPARAAFARVAFDGRGELSVPSTTLDRLTDRLGERDVALVKVDVEGAEPEALEGAQRAARRCPVLLVEFTEPNLARRGRTSGDLALQLRGLGYQLMRFSGESRRLEPYQPIPPVWYTNVLAVRDPLAVNLRLAAAEPWRVEIAHDILERARECAPLLRASPPAGTAAEDRAWAERAEAALARERETSEANRRWAERAEVALAEARRRSEANREWALRAEEALSAERASSPGRAWDTAAKASDEGQHQGKAEVDEREGGRSG